MLLSLPEKAKRMIRYHFNKGKNVLETFYEGDIELNDINKFADELANNNDLPRQLKIISDARNANYIFSKDDIPEVIEMIKDMSTNYETIKVAFLQSKPLETAFSSIFANRQNIPNYFQKIFSTPEAAWVWLLSEDG